ncbi:ATP-binding cassette domain-containing protein [Vibrio nigripulchritudo]|uniref:ATP-binding cassette domain-containing protein n=1 Tax=Vibrio nigripulchritudo TaxID=28173 RepID=UPI0024925766|nr:ATP-binding cassette domain-containing protein [Vibrio nigripulchritudo]BDU37482.1 ABC transporter ATP-binding protein [Vibrio nigripulchritudo]BDU43202.1 ABC transporter ATP-binding protein [Vibrio nigripulchritudo]
MTLQLTNLVIHDRHNKALFNPVSFEVKDGEVFTLMGPSGCGKSTLLSAIAGHLSDDFSFDGAIQIEGKDVGKISPHLRRAGFLFQDDLLFPHLNIWENLAFALPNTVKGQARNQQAMQALEKVGLAKLANSFPNQVSGGQRARVSLLRMLLAQPRVALLDEPFSKLDKDLRVQFREWVFQQLREANIPTLMVTHDEADVPVNSSCLSWPWENAHA